MLKRIEAKWFIIIGIILIFSSTFIGKMDAQLYIYETTYDNMLTHVGDASYSAILATSILKFQIFGLISTIVGFYVLNQNNKYTK